MALPTIDTRTKTITLGKRKVKVRAFTVAEERIILTAKLMNDASSMLNAVISVITNCTGEDASEMTEAELQQLFAEIYSISVSDVVEPNFICQKCGEPNPAKIPVSKLNFPETLRLEKTFDVGKSVDGQEVKMVLHSPTMGALAEIADDEKDADVKLIHKSLVGIFTPDDTITSVSYEEFSTWFNSLKGVLADCLLFLKKQPSVTYKRKFVCSACRAENEIELEGFRAFFH